MNRREANDLDNWITGHYGEDYFDNEDAGDLSESGRAGWAEAQAEEEDEDEEEDEAPEEGDFVIFDSGPLGSRTSVAIVGEAGLGEFKVEEDARVAIRERAERDQFWPSVWYQDDHGGLQRIEFRYFPIFRRP